MFFIGLKALKGVLRIQLIQSICQSGHGVQQTAHVVTQASNVCPAFFQISKPH